MITHTHDIVTIWPATGTPERMVWNGRRIRITDQPTPRTEEHYHEAVTHPMYRIEGWRFQGADETGYSRVFDITLTDDGWELVGVYD